MPVKLLILSLYSLLLMACSTSDLYYKPLSKRPVIPWKGSSDNWGGYLETSPRKDTFNISFEAYNNPNAEAAAFFTILRAAERAAIDGKSHFFITKALHRNSRAEESFFPAYTKAGYWYTRRYRHCDTCPKTGKNINCRYQYRRFWEPPEYIPAERVMNYIHQSSIQISYQGKVSKRRNTRELLLRALADPHGYGAPRLDPRAMAFLAHSDSHRTLLRNR